MRIVSWNVNGLRAVMTRKDLDWALGAESDVDVVCLQETKIQEDALTPAMKSPPGFRSFWTFGKKKGYSGTAVFVRDAVPVERFAFSVGGAEHPEYDDEGRVVALDLGALILLNVYFPNGGSSDERLVYKHAWHEAFLSAVAAVRARTGRPVVVVGDFNIGHRAIDVARPEQWSVGSGFLDSERAWMDRFLASGFVDSFRAEKGDIPRQYTFWETRVDARKENIGWRIDYVMISKDLEEQMNDAWISPGIMGSDHCPVGVELDVAVKTRATEEWEIADDPDATNDGDDDELWKRR